MHEGELSSETSVAYSMLPSFADFDPVILLASSALLAHVCKLRHLTCSY